MTPRSPAALDALEARREAAAESLTAATSTVRVLQRRLSRGAGDVLGRADEDLYQGRWGRVPSRSGTPDVIQLPD